VSFSRNKWSSSCRRCASRPSLITASTTTFHRAFPTAATSWKRSASCRGPSIRWNAGSPSSAPANAGWSSWRGTASKASTATGGAKHSLVQAWRERLARHGRETQLGGDLILGFSFYIADTEEEAIRAATPIVEEYQKMFGPLGFVGPLSDEQLSMLGDPKRARKAGLPTITGLIEAGAWLCGPSEHIARKLLEMQETYPGLEEVMVGQPVGTPRAVICEQLELFADKVLPLVQRG
jgi:alkanesulfonate monooxygenase SsuD/methylene tetrahydromethanopterin reductase-like flavin-dependent oxidoreductase (luciferase family)